MTTVNHPITPFVLGIFFNITDNNIATAKKHIFDKYGSLYASQPHFSLLVTPLLRENEENLKKELQMYFGKLKPFTVKIGGLDFENKHKFYQLTLVSDELKSVHQDLLLLVQKYRGDAVRQKDLKRIAEGYYSPEELKMFDKWGYARCDEQFEAHITIGNIARDASFNEVEVTNKLNNMLGPSRESGFVVDKVVVELQIDKEDLKNLATEWSEQFNLGKLS